MSNPAPLWDSQKAFMAQLYAVVNAATRENDRDPDSIECVAWSSILVEMRDDLEKVQKDLKAFFDAHYNARLAKRRKTDAFVRRAKGQ